MVDLSQRERSVKLNRRGNKISLSLSLSLSLESFASPLSGRFFPVSSASNPYISYYIISLLIGARKAWFALVPSSFQLDSGKYSNYRSSSSIIGKQSSRDYFIYSVYNSNTRVYRIDNWGFSFPR